MRKLKLVKFKCKKSLTFKIFRTTNEKKNPLKHHFQNHSGNFTPT